MAVVRVAGGMVAQQRERGAGAGGGGGGAVEFVADGNGSAL